MPSMEVRLYNSPSDREERINSLDFDIERQMTNLPSTPNEFERRTFIMAATAALAFLPVQSAKAYQDEITDKKSLEDLQFARGSWNQVTAAKDNSIDVADQNLLASTTNDSTIASTQNNAAIKIDACFTTYLTRFLINYDEGVAAWWQQLQIAYSLLPNDQQQSRLGRDFGSLAASIEEALQIYIEKANTNRQGYETLFERFASTYATGTNGDEVR